MAKCIKCGEVLVLGFYDPWDSGSRYICENCFEKYMDETYGEGKWNVVPEGEVDELGGYYEYVNENDASDKCGTGIFWTDFYDDDNIEEEML